MKDKLLGGLLTIIVIAMLILVGLDKGIKGDPKEVYQVYLNGDSIGLIESKDELLDLIDEEQKDIKKKYNVDKVYPPDGLDIEKVYTYDDDIESAQTIYDEIKDNESFTIEGYVLTITYTEEDIKNDQDSEGIRKPKKIYLMNKDIVKGALYDTATAFIGTLNLENFENDTQTEITDTGSIITSVYFKENITVKKALISTDEYIFSDEAELSQYLLYGSLDKQTSYTVKDGEDLETIANNNSLNIEELMIANPQFTNSNVLLTAGDKVNVSLIDPLVSVVYNKTVVEDIDVSYKTTTIKDNTKYTDYKKVTTEGQNGVTRITQDITYVNGEINSLYISKKETLKDAVNEEVVVGTKKKVVHSGGNGYYYYNASNGNDTWSWPTISPFIITSKYKWRWGRQHQGIDISGCGYGSPIYAVKDGVVIHVNYDTSKSEGMAIWINHGNGIITQYMHLSKINVKMGQVVKREQKIGAMGKSGSATGTHLHLGVSHGVPYKEGSYFVDPCKSIFKC